MRGDQPLPFFAPADNAVATRPAYYTIAIRKQLDAVQGRRSWDAFTDVFAPAYDDVLRTMHDQAECIAVAIAFIEYVLGEPPPRQLRALVARLVRSHGKAALYGYHEALQRVADDDPVAIHRYALAVAKRVTAELRRTKEHTTQ